MQVKQAWRQVYQVMFSQFHLVKGETEQDEMFIFYAKRPNFPGIPIVAEQSSLGGESVFEIIFHHIITL